MLKHWKNLLNTECKVVKIGTQTVYPIFKVGSTSLFSVADETYINEQIGKCAHIEILIRDPRDRFVSGINEFCRQNKLDVLTTWRLVKDGKIIDRHFAPQFIWLFHLYKFYKGKVTLKPFQHIKTITTTHIKTPNDRTKPVAVELLRSFVEIDYALMENYNQPIALGDLIKDNKNVLS